MGAQLWCVFSLNLLKTKRVCVDDEKLRIGVVGRMLAWPGMVWEPHRGWTHLLLGEQQNGQNSKHLYPGA